MTTIPQRELRNNVSDVLRRAEAGEHFTVTVDGRPVAELGPRSVERGHGPEDWAAIVALGEADENWSAQLRAMRDEDDAAGLDPWR